MMKRIPVVMIGGILLANVVSLLLSGCLPPADTSHVRTDTPTGPAVTISLTAQGLTGTVVNMPDTKFDKIQSVALVKPAEGSVFAQIKAGKAFKFSPKEDMLFVVTFSVIRTVQGQATTVACKTPSPLALGGTAAAQCGGDTNATGEDQSNMTDAQKQMATLCTQRGGKVEVMGDLGCTCASGNFVSFGAAGSLGNFQSIMDRDCPH